METRLKSLIFALVLVFCAGSLMAQTYTTEGRWIEIDSVGNTIDFSPPTGNYLFENLYANTPGDLWGGAICLDGIGTVIGTFSGNFIFNTNTANRHGGAIFLWSEESSSSLSFDAGSISFSGNVATTGQGGGIYSYGETSSSVNLTANEVYFSDNRANSGGGGISSDSNGSSSVVLTAGIIDFSNNSSANSYGSGGIFSIGWEDFSEIILIADNGTINFYQNSSAYGGGGIYSHGGERIGNHPHSYVTLTADNGEITFTGNSTGAYGGGIYSQSYASSNITLTADSGTITFSGNTAVYEGGGIASSAQQSTSIVLNVGDNGEILFSENKAGSGGGIASFGEVNHSTPQSIISLVARNEGTITFSDNYATTDNGGGIWTLNGDSGTQSAVSLTTGDDGAINFADNYAAGFGGGIYISGFSNQINLTGGAGSSIIFRGNKHGVTFTGSDPVVGTGTANAIYLNNSNDAELNFTIGSGGVIEFYDPIASNNNAAIAVNINDISRSLPTLSMGTVILNGEDYIDEADINRYYDMITDTTVYAGAFGLANNVIYGRTGGNSTVNVENGAVLFSGNTLGRNDINNMINADITNYGSLYFLNNVNNTYNTLSVNSYDGVSDIYLNFNSDSGDSDVLAIANGAFGDHIVSAAGTGDGTLLVIPNVITVGQTSDAETFTGGGMGGLYYYNLEQSSIGNWDLVRSEDSYTDALEPTLLNLGWTFRSIHDNLLSRMGELRKDRGGVDNGVWARFYHSELDFKTRADRSIAQRYNGVEVGFDKVKESDSANTYYGLFGNYLSTTDKSVFGNGHVSNVLLGLYATKIYENGQYFDIVGRVGDFFGNYNAKIPTEFDIKINTWMASLSGEYGVRKDLGHDYLIEPQAQFIIGRIGGFTDSTSNGLTSKYSNVDSAIGRFGLNFTQNFEKNQIYFTGSVFHDFAKNPSLTVSADDITATIANDYNSNTWYKAALGANVQLSENGMGYLEASRLFAKSIGGNWRFILGARFVF